MSVRMGIINADNVPTRTFVMGKVQLKITKNGHFSKWPNLKKFKFSDQRSAIATFWHVFGHNHGQKNQKNRDFSF